jgi:hypothetical protein
MMNPKLRPIQCSGATGGYALNQLDMNDRIRQRIVAAASERHGEGWYGSPVETRSLRIACSITSSACRQHIAVSQALEKLPRIAIVGCGE